MSNTVLIISDVLPGPPGPEGPPGPAGSSIKISKVLAYDINNRLSLITDSSGTKSFSYDVSGKLISITGTGSYQSQSFTYSSGKLTNVDIT